MASYSQLRVLSYRLQPEALRPLPFWQVSFPEKWKGPIMALQAARSRRTRPETSVPIDSLNHSVRAFLPNIIGLDAWAGKIGPRPWIFAEGPIDLGVLHLIARMWVKVHFGEQPDVDRVLTNMRLEDLIGEQAEQPVEIRQSRGGTAEPGERLFMLLPNMLAAKLASSGKWLDEGQGPRDLVRVVGGVDTPAEVMTWPPYVHQRRNGEWHFSLVLRFSLQTVPFDEHPIVNLELITRRWLRASGSNNKFFRLGKEQSSTAYFRSQIHWLGAEVTSDNFQVAPVGWQRREEGFEIAWSDKIGQLATELSWPRFPDVKRLSTDPAACIAGDPTIAIAFDTGLKPDHEVAAGWMPGDRKPMFVQASQKLADLLQPVSNLQRNEPQLTRKATAFEIHMPPRPDDKEELKKWLALRQEKLEQAERRQILARLIRKELRIELLHQTTEMVHALRDALTELLGVTAEDHGSLYVWRWEGASMELLVRRLGALGAELPVVAEARTTQDYLRSVAERAQQIRDDLQRSSSRGCIIELPGASAFGRNIGGDPKDAIRKGAAMAGRPTQFITPPTPKTASDDEETGSAGVPHRARAAWLDLFRQLGAVPVNLDFSAVDSPLPPNLQMVGVWLHNLNWSPERPGVRLPVIVCMSADGRPTLARVATPELPNWLPYPEALAALAARPKLQFHEFGKDSVVHFLRDALEADLLPRGPVLLMASAQNLRGSWKWLQNPALAKDQVQLPPGGPRTIADWSGLRLVRLRTSERGETPECYAEDGDDVGISKGLWRWSDRVYASTASKPDAMKVVSPSQSRLRTYQTSRGEFRSAAPGRVAWNPALLEITTAALQEGDDPAVWAHAVHQLRFAAIHFEQGLALPLPLHLAKQMEEYVLPLESARNQ